MIDLLDKALNAYLSDNHHIDFPTTLDQRKAALERVVSLVIEAAAKVADDRGNASTNGSMAQYHCYAVGSDIRSLLNKGE